MIEEAAIMRLLLEGTHRPEEDEDSDDNEGYMFVLFRKVFDKMDDRQKHVNHIESINEDFCHSFFDSEIDLKELHGMVTMNNLGEQQIKIIYDYLRTIPALKKIIDSVDLAVPE